MLFFFVIIAKLSSDLDDWKFVIIQYINTFVD